MSLIDEILAIIIVFRLGYRRTRPSIMGGGRFVTLIDIIMGPVSSNQNQSG